MRINILITFIVLLINYNTFYNLYLIDTSFFLLIYKLCVYFVVILFLLHLFSFSKILQKIWIVVLLILSLFEIYFINNLGIVINYQVIKNTFNTNINEATELLSFDFYIYIFVAFITIGLIYKFIISKIKRITILNYFLILITIVVVFIGLTKIDKTTYRYFIKNDTDKIVPLNFFPAMQKYLNRKSRDETIDKTNISNEFKLHQTSKIPLITVMIVGESARADRLSINGYIKNTTPYMKVNKNIISFTNASSCDTSTMSSVPCMMQRFTHDEFKFPIKETSFVQVFSDLGFDTHWLTLQDEAKVIDTFCQEAKHCVNLSNSKYDMESLDKINKIVKNAKQNTLIVLHIMGSHFNYNSRVENKNKIFKPIEKDRVYKSGDKLDNSYDNSIYQTDIFLDSVFKLLKKKNAFLLYSSDHGESLGEKQYGVFERFGHASPYDIAPKEQTNVPFILWYSDVFMKNNNIKLTTNTKSDKISHDYIFSTILGCSGFIGKYVEDRYNICKSIKVQP